MALMTAAEYKAFYKALTGTAEDATIDIMIGCAGGLMAASCGFPLPDSGGHTLEDTIYTLRIDGPSAADSRVLDLGVKPVLSVTTAHSDSDWDFGANTLVPAGDLELDINRGRLWLRSNASRSWSTSPRSNKVVVVAGFATVPPALVAMCAASVRHLMDGNRIGSMSNLSQGGTSITRSDADSLLPKSVVDGLGPFRIWGASVG